MQLQKKRKRETKRSIKEKCDSFAIFKLCPLGSGKTHLQSKNVILILIKELKDMTHLFLIQILFSRNITLY